MKLPEENKQLIKEKFWAMQTKEDLISLLNDAKKLAYKNTAYDFQTKQITYYSHPRIAQNRYTSFSIAKKNGSPRSIHAPVKGLKAIQKSLNVIFQCFYEAPKTVTGFVPAKSIVDNARAHTQKSFVYNIDLKDFFSSIDQARVWKCLQLPPFNLNEGNRIKIASMIAALCCTEMEVERWEDNEWKKVQRNVLPQGAPTSPILTNIVAHNLDRRLNGLAKKFYLTYTRYADDITFSSMHNVYTKEEFLSELHRIICDQNFHIKDSKTRLQKLGYKQEVTGLLVNKEVNVHRRYIKDVRKWLYLWETYGYQKTYTVFLQAYKEDKGHVKQGIPDLGNVLSGKIDYLKMVKGKENPLYAKLKGRLEALQPTLPILEASPAKSKSPETEKAPIQALEKAPANQTKLIKETAILLPILHHPKRLVELLENFSTNNSALKHTTHSWDSGRKQGIFKNYTDFLNKAKEEYSKFSWELRQLKEYLNGKIHAFLMREDLASSKQGWGAHHIKFGWSSPELIKWCNDNPDKNPEDYELDVAYRTRVDGTTIQKFKHVIDLFKNEIEIRDEYDVLRQLLIHKHDTYLPGFEIESATNLENKTFKTDVLWLSSALDLIFAGIQTRPYHKRVRYAVDDSIRGQYTLEITHLDSYNSSKSYRDSKLTLQKGDFGSIKNQLMNLCDWSVESSFKEGNLRINYLSSVSKPHVESVDNVEGFKHLLTFYT